MKSLRNAKINRGIEALFRLAITRKEHMGGNLLRNLSLAYCRLMVSPDLRKTPTFSRRPLCLEQAHVSGQREESQRVVMANNGGGWGGKTDSGYNTTLHRHGPSEGKVNGGLWFSKWTKGPAIRR